LAICHQSKQEQLQPKRKVQAIVISLLSPREWHEFGPE